MHVRVLRDSGAVEWLLGFFWQNSGVLPQLCVHNYNNYDYDNENNKKIFISHHASVWSVFSRILKGRFLPVLHI